MLIWILATLGAIGSAAIGGFFILPALQRRRAAKRALAPGQPLFFESVPPPVEE